MVREIKSFVYGECNFEQAGNNPAIIVEVAARKKADLKLVEQYRRSIKKQKQIEWERLKKKYGEK